MKWLVFLLFPCLAAAQGTEIYLFDLKLNKGDVIIANGKNITNHPGYDNQPRFHPKLPFIYFSRSIDSATYDWMRYNYVTAKTDDITGFPEQKFSPTVTPDAKFISGILLRVNKMQDLIKVPVKGGNPIVLVSDLKVGYHAWTDDHSLLLFVLENDSLNRLYHYDLLTKQRTVIGDRPARTLAAVPGEKATSFILQTTKDLWSLYSFDNVGKQTKLIAEIPALQDMAWVNRDLILFSERNHIRTFNPNTKTWGEVKIEGDTSFIKNMARLAVSPDGKHLAVVIAE